MMNVCYQCGLYRADKVIDPSGRFAICPECGYHHPFRQLPLLVIAGASGAGKSTVCRQLLGQMAQAVLLDSDILWRQEFNTPENRYRDFFETWLRMCKNISQSGRPVILFGAGLGVPENIEPCVERRYFSQVHYLALVCAEETLSARLQERPLWRGAQAPGFIDANVRFNRWFQEYNDQPPIRRLDTTHRTPEETAAQAAAWIQEIISSSNTIQEFPE